MCKPTRTCLGTVHHVLSGYELPRGSWSHGNIHGLVVDHADVLHQRVHARRPDEAAPLRLQLLRERFRPSRTDDSHRVIHGSPSYSDAKR
jgi:hypothetical protein